MKRRDFLSGMAAAAAVSGQATKSTDTPQSQNRGNLQVPRTTPAKNIMISAANGITPRGNHIEAGYKKLAAGADTLEAAITTVSGPENDPEDDRSEQHTSELQSRQYLVCRLLLEKK